MTEVSLHPTPRGRDVVREQVRIVGLALRREALALAVILAIGSLVIGTAIVRGTAATWFDSDDWVPITIVAFLFSIAVWWRDRPFHSAFLWTLPVDRRRLVAAKAFAGWLWLMIALAVFVVWEKTLAAVSGITGAQTMPLIAFIGATAAYLLGSAVVIGLRHPLRWALGTAGVLFLLRGLDQVLSRGPSVLEALLKSSGLISAVEDAATVWPFLCLGAGLIALWGAISRHKENH